MVVMVPIIIEVVVEVVQEKQDPLMEIHKVEMELHLQ